MPRLPVLALALLLNLTAGADARAAPGSPPIPAPASAPAGATGLCGDGDYTRLPERRGACKGRQGVKAWWGPASAPGTGGR